MYRNKEVNVFLMLGASIFVCEMTIMIFLSFFPPLNTFLEAIVDASILSIFIFPIVYFLLFKPLKKSISDRNFKEAKYLHLIESIGETVILTNENELVVFANPAASQLFEVELIDLIDQSLEKYFTKERFEFIVSQLPDREKGISGIYESEILVKNGKSKQVLINATPQFENNLFIGTLAIIRDISTVKKWENSIKYERNLLRTLIDNLPDAVYVKDISCKKIIANPVDLQYMGHASEIEIIGKSDHVIYEKDIADSSNADDLLVLNTGKAILNKEDYFVDNNGVPHWMLNSKVPFKNENNEVIGLVGIGREVTALKKEEIRLKLLESVITNATDAVVITKVDHSDFKKNKIIFVNESYCKMTGYTLEEVVGKSPSILQGINTNQEEIQKVGLCLRNNEACNMQVINYKKDGTQFWTNISFSPILNEYGEATHWIAIKRDTTSQKKLEQDYINAKEKAESANKAKSEFLANMSHEIRTPLNSVIGFSELLIKTKLEDIQHQYISAVFHSANSLLEIINEILDFSKIEAGKLEMDIVKSDVIEMCYAVSDIVTFPAAKKNLELLVNIGSEVPRFIWTDSIRLKQVLVNLAANAVKFTSKGEVEIKLELVQKNDSGDNCNLRFSVRDTGIGIKIENQVKIFEAFSQEDSSTSRKFGGTGLGLAISKKLLYLLGSNLQLLSTPGEGSVFYFDLSVKCISGAKEVWSDINNISRVLIVDDNFNNRVLVKNILSLRGIQSEEAEDGESCIRMVQLKKYDIIFLDYNMPGMDGIEVLKLIREKLGLSQSLQHIILLHSSAEDHVINEACSKYGVYFRILKPIRSNALVEAISKLTNQPIDLNEKLSVDEVEPTIKKGVYKVLLVDDNDFNIMLIKQMIMGILPDSILFEAKNGKEAVEKFRENLPDIVFMDVQMPELNGHEATQIIRSLEKGLHIPIIALTAGTNTAELNLCLESGMNDVITKPFLTNALVEIIFKWLK